jgi:hypothetical protein
LRGGDSVAVQPLRDRRVALTNSAFPRDPVDDLLRQCARAPEPHAAETLEALGDEATMDALRRSDEDVAAGRVFDWDEVKRDLGLA